MKNNSKIYFASDFHLGSFSTEKEKERENRIISWLTFIEKDASEIFLVGDIFDFWFEHKYTVPKGNIRFLGKISQLVDKGIKIHFFTGNHDLWMFDYLEKEIGVHIIRDPITIQLNNKTLMIGHGDGLGPGDLKYKFIKKFFTNKFCQWVFSKIHPNISFFIARYWSRKSKENEKHGSPPFLGEDKEWLIQYCKKQLILNDKINYFIFGHRHLPIEHKINDECYYINLGDWVEHFTYAILENNKLELIKFN
ncbi:MAG: UDP-2,3-diacylglucosamine hydrolase [Crocinitomicaceae bacterium]|nr:UDP-2,3-diacylglucosamine hydrolase [Crocinitomicaceae bacterium]